MEQPFNPDNPIRTRFRFSWLYWLKPDCGTPNYWSDSGAEDGNHFRSYKSYCDRVYKSVMESDLCPDKHVEGGACVILYEIIKSDVDVDANIPYILTKDKRGYKIAFRIDAKGKKRRIKYALAQKRIQTLKKRRRAAKRKVRHHILNMAELGDGCSWNG